VYTRLFVYFILITVTGRNFRGDARRYVRFQVEIVIHSFYKLLVRIKNVAFSFNLRQGVAEV